MPTIKISSTNGLKEGNNLAMSLPKKRTFFDWLLRRHPTELLHIKIKSVINETTLEIYDESDDAIIKIIK